MAIYPPKPVLSWPNLEEFGILCISPDVIPWAPDEITEQPIICLFNEAHTLVNELCLDEGRERFEDEFVSYWNRWEKRSGRFVSLCEPKGPCRWVYSYDYPNFKLVAETKATIVTWGLNLYGRKPKSNAIQRIPFAVLKKPWRPEQYPGTVRHLLSSISGCEEAEKIVQEYILEPPTDGRKKILVGFPGKNGFGFAGLIFPRGDSSPRRKGYNHNRSPIDKLSFGFRNGMLPENVYLARMNAMPLRGAPVNRCDAPWIHGRGYNPKTEMLMEKTVVFIGLGSLGSGVGELLAKMGVGRAIFVDPDDLEPENASRHTLGVSPVAVKKTEELAKNLRSRFPHLRFDSYAMRWEHLNQRQPQILLSADLVIVTTGDWEAEGPLNLLVKNAKGFPPIIFGWVEDHAVAGHATAFFPGKGCMRCLVDQKGRPKIPVTHWPDRETVLAIPMCGGMFQPYGAIELLHSHGLVADLAIDVLLGVVNKPEHRIWIGQQKVLFNGGGDWNPEWCGKYGDPGYGAKILTVPFSPDNDCPVCKGLR